MIWPTKPSPQSILGGMMALLMVGCVSTKKYHQDLNVEYVRGLQKARHIAAYSKCDEAVERISLRIKEEQELTQ